MKKLLFALALLAGTTTAAHAQKVSFGLKAGLGATTFAGYGLRLYDVKPGLIIGGVAALPMGKRVSFRPELLFVQKGWQRTRSDGYALYKVKLNYIDLPLMFRVTPASNGWFLETGPQVGFMLGYPNEERGSHIDNSKVYHSFEVGAAAGVGYQLANGLSFGVRYNGGITNILRPRYNAYANQYYQPTARNSALQLTASYMFGAR